MTHTSEERVPQAPGSDDAPQSAQIIPFERPQNELQRAVQRRAQEHLEALSVKPKKSFARQAITFAIALIPVGIIFTGFVVSVQAVRFISSLYLSPQATANVEQPAQPVVEDPPQQQPGVVMLLPDKTIQPIKPAEKKEEPPKSPPTP
ncbi:hypothetical protein HNQ60_004030 [Povalibacter uvarum]|uniref:Uncharacterized protein n=1 Tax=Povalibacter uvarum TaxID=732238 RepID=A0A841HSF7_9GAMM|nr:hypothetical protein [Povalibacter uvarum]MBB6095140.1 hypothetical protein [Povalibacter uvarum]